MKKVSEGKSVPQYEQRNITCEFYSLESADENCSICSNKAFCRKSRKGIKARNIYIEEYNKRADWANFVKEVTDPKLMPIKGSKKQSLVDHENKAPRIPEYQKEENILKLNWDGFYARAHTPKRKSGETRGRIGRRSTVSESTLKKIEAGNIPVLRMEI